MYCSKCGNIIEDGAKFCSACGEPAADMTPAVNTDAEASAQPNGINSIGEDFIRSVRDEAPETVTPAPISEEERHINAVPLEEITVEPQKKKGKSRILNRF